MKEISDGDKEYERDVTQKFLKAVPMALRELRDAWNKGDKETMKRIAHNLKTTISVMGLNDVLNPLLDEIEVGNSGLDRTRENIDQIHSICNKAIEEANIFLASLD
jgi:hypothetical protein